MRHPEGAVVMLPVVGFLLLLGGTMIALFMTVVVLGRHSNEAAVQAFGIAVAALGLAILVMVGPEQTYRDWLACNTTGPAGVERGCLRGRN